MTKVAVTETYLTDIADAIRQQTGSVDTYKPSEMASAILDIPSGGGGSSPWTHIKHAEYTVSTTSTSSVTVATLQCGTDVWTSSKIVYVRVRDVAGARAGYFVGSDTFFVNVYPVSGGTKTSEGARIITRCRDGMRFVTVNSTYGVYPYTMYKDGRIQINSRYSTSGSLTIDGTYSVDVFTLDYPEGYPSPFVV